MSNVKYPVVNGKKQCADCKQMKPVAQFHKARKHYTTSCRSCRAIYFAEYRQRPEVKSAALEYTRAYRKDPTHREKQNENCRRYRKTPASKSIRNAARKAWTAREKQKAVDYKGGKCVGCGYGGCLAALDFHHLNPKEKEGLKAHWSFEKNRKELDKCVLVCVRCHREVHAGARTL
jgi:hypothetical protein